jgi:hypothetical protein
MATLEPAPDQPLMWLAAYTGENIATAVDYRIAYDLTKAKDRTGTGEGYLSTITAGRVATNADVSRVAAVLAPDSAEDPVGRGDDLVLARPARDIARPMAAHG